MMHIRVLLIILIACTGLFGATGAIETPERVFNAANEAMVKGEDAFAIELYYRLIKNHSKFRSYRDDTLYRLGTLLYKTERYDEAEKIFQMLITKYPEYKNIKKVYEKLIIIYSQALGDEAKAQNMRDIYARRFGTDPKLKAMDKTMDLLAFDENKASKVLSLKPKDIVIGDVVISKSLDKEFFPVRNYVKRNVKSMDRRYEVKLKTSKKGRNLYITDSLKKRTWKVPDSRNGFGPVWSWDSRYLFFTETKSKSRSIKMYDLKNKLTKTLFSGKDIEPLLCVAPDSSKIVFVYANRLWIMNKSGSSISLLKRNVKVHNVRLTAWSRDGDRFLIRTSEKTKRYYTFKLKKKELRILQ